MMQHRSNVGGFRSYKSNILTLRNNKIPARNKVEKAKGSITETKIKAIFEFEDELIAKIRVTVEFDNETDAEGLVVNKPYILTLTPEPGLDDYTKEATEP